jgi:hypothetical protein
MSFVEKHVTGEKTQQTTSLARHFILFSKKKVKLPSSHVVFTPFLYLGYLRNYLYWPGCFSPSGSAQGPPMRPFSQRGGV